LISSWVDRAVAASSAVGSGLSASPLRREGDWVSRPGSKAAEGRALEQMSTDCKVSLMEDVDVRLIRAVGPKNMTMDHHLHAEKAADYARVQNACRPVGRPSQLALDDHGLQEISGP
jgi:hypothetical protein